MAHNYSTLTGDKIVKSIRKQNRHMLVTYILAVPFLCLFLVGTLMYIIQKRDEYVIGVIAIVVLSLLLYADFSSIGKTRKVLAEAEHCALFRKFGSPEQIAAKIAEESTAPLLDSRGTMICKSFIMKHGNFESYIPFEQALLVYRQEHSTNGIKDAVFLVVQDVYGDSVQYQFKMGKKGKEMMQEMMAHISQQNEQCVFGYSQQNLSYARANMRPVPTDIPPHADA